jgi:hypothetical protein
VSAALSGVDVSAAPASCPPVDAGTHTNVVSDALFWSSSSSHVEPLAHPCPATDGSQYDTQTPVEVLEDW